MRAPEDLTRIIRIQKAEQLDGKNYNLKVIQRGWEFVSSNVNFKCSIAGSF